MDRSQRALGYQTIEGGMGPNGHATYDELAGKIVTVTRAVFKNGSAVNAWAVTFTLDSTGDTYTTRATILPNEKPDDASVDHLVALRDLQVAHDKYLGKNYWMKGEALPALAENGTLSSSHVVRFKKSSQVTVSDVLASGETDRPVRLVIRNDLGQEGFFDLAVSDTNRGISGAEIGDVALGKVLAETDPGPGHK